MSITTRSSLIFVLSCLAGCATFELEGTGSLTPDARRGSETVHGSLYGFKWREFDVEKCGTDQLFRVEFHTNAGLLLASIVSLGLYVPQTVEWWCYRPEADDDGEEVWVPPAEEGME